MDVYRGRRQQCDQADKVLDATIEAVTAPEGIDQNSTSKGRQEDGQHPQNRSHNPPTADVAVA